MRGVRQGVLWSQINRHLCTTAGPRLVTVLLCMCVVHSSPDLGGVFSPSVIKPTGPPSRHSIPTCAQLTVCLMYVVYHEQPPHIISHTCTSIIPTVNIPFPHTLIGLDCPDSHPFPLMRDFKKPRINISRPSLHVFEYFLLI